jgi:GntR family transcriptional regulator, rspAB operon transcriptional repressor
MPRKGIMVKPVTLDEILNIIEARLVNESYCARRAASHADAADITRMLENLDATWAAAKERAIDKLMFLDRQFHGYLSSISRNDILVDILSNLHDRSARLWFISLRANEQHVRVCEQHAAIVEGIRQHDPDAAENAIRLHIKSFRENLTLQI